MTYLTKPDYSDFLIDEYPVGVYETDMKRIKYEADAKHEDRLCAWFNSGGGNSPFGKGIKQRTKA